MLKRFSGAAAAIAAAALFTFGLASSASATTDACKSAFGNQCGTFQTFDIATPPNQVFFDVKAASTAVGTPIIGYNHNGQSDLATDLVKVQHLGPIPGVIDSNSTTISYSLVFVRGGVWTNKCVSVPASGAGLALKPCNGLRFQRLIASSSGAGALTFNGTSVNGSYVPNFGGSTFTLQSAAFPGQFVEDVALATGPQTPDLRQLKVATTSSINPNQIVRWIP